MKMCWDIFTCELLAWFGPSKRARRSGRKSKMGPHWQKHKFTPRTSPLPFKPAFHPPVHFSCTQGSQDSKLSKGFLHAFTSQCSHHVPKSCFDCSSTHSQKRNALARCPVQWNSVPVMPLQPQFAFLYILSTAIWGGFQGGCKETMPMVRMVSRLSNGGRESSYNFSSGLRFLGEV